MHAHLYIDIAAIIAGGVHTPEPDTLALDAGGHLFYSGEFNLIHGDPESGKTWLCLTAVAAALAAGGKAAIIDLDHNGAHSIINRLQQLGVDNDTLADHNRFRLAEPETSGELQQVINDLRTFEPTVVTIDSLGEVLPLFGANSNNADDFTRVHAAVISPLAKAGVAVLAVDHLPKNADSRQFGPTGTNAKNRAVGGTSVRVTNTHPFVPGHGGAATLELFKDRHGGIRQHLPTPNGSGSKAVIGTFTLAVDEETGVLHYTITQDGTGPSAAKSGRDMETDVLTLMEKHEQGINITVNSARMALGCGQKHAMDAVRLFKIEINTDSA
ncbi:AAA family ATPase [Mycobacteroides abscessus]|uniref:AAA family ATPase n=1 Tax=Mycobacteroides abscessus TaxID=36809 RepID=UPI0009CCBC80|nr:AAA family ATPase [Mycobacteroides abscessus]SKN99595.1 bifunctional DNA primase/polymerase famiily protein [Mycobacteroides abscessus subsp. bolletii]SKW94625.1 bifunctional DNA primase/polymerase famiily protein [Mycobacteroides abscessus subsp. bolletii]